jgi:peptidoglycan hydrolase-like protein with peptidoglycan-binding domain
MIRNTPFTRSLTLNSFGLDVIDLQNVLQEWGFGEFVPTGFFGNKTRNAVIAFQRAYNISPATGFFGEITRAKMNEVLGIPKSEILYAIAKSLLHIDASPDDRAPDEVGCADTVNCVFKSAFGHEIGGTVSTHDLYLALKASPEFVQTANPVRGDIIISPTGFGDGRMQNGHVGIVSDNNTIMSNSSSTGTFEQNYTILAWRSRYGVGGGFPVVFFHLK